MAPQGDGSVGGDEATGFLASLQGVLHPSRKKKSAWYHSFHSAHGVSTVCVAKQKPCNMFELVVLKNQLL